MSVQVNHFIVHQIGLDNEEKLTVVPREACLHNTPALEILCHQLNHSFNSKPGKGIGSFGGENDTFVSELNTYLKGGEGQHNPQGFLQFSVAAAKQLLTALINTNTVETGFLVISDFDYLATRYLMVGLLNTREHIEVNHELELNAKEHLDIARMQLAVKIDITQYQVQPEQARYISFIKGRMGRKVSDFFMQFVGCEERVDVKQQNKLLVSSVEQYLAEEPLDMAEKDQHRQQVKDYMQSKHSEGEEIALTEIATHLPTDLANKRDFTEFLENRETELEPSFSPDPAAVRQLAKFSGQGGGISMSFERKLLGERIQYDPASDTLTLVGLPPNLKDQLLRAVQSPEQE